MIGISGQRDLATLARSLGQVLGVEFEDRESSHYAGGTYYLAHPGELETIRVYANQDAIDGTPIYETSHAYPSLLRLVLTDRAPQTVLRDVQAEVDPAARILKER